jgi:hypothetical protein
MRHEHVWSPWLKGKSTLSGKPYAGRLCVRVVKRGTARGPLCQAVQFKRGVPKR